MVKICFSIAVICGCLTVVFLLGSLAGLVDLTYAQDFNAKHHKTRCTYAGYNFQRLYGVLYAASVTVIDTGDGVWVKHRTTTINPTQQEEIFKQRYPLNVWFDCYVSRWDMQFELLNASFSAYMTIILASLSVISAIVSICATCCRLYSKD